MPRHRTRTVRAGCSCLRLAALVVMLLTGVADPAHLRTHVGDGAGGRHRLLLSGRHFLASAEAHGDRSGSGHDRGEVLGRFFGKKKQGAPVRGCTRKTAENFVKAATEDDGSCFGPQPHDLTDDGRYRFYRSDMDDESPLFIDPALRRIWRNARFDRGAMTSRDVVGMTDEEKRWYGIERGTNSSSGSGGGGTSTSNSNSQAAIEGPELPHLVLPVGEPIPQALDDRLHTIELQAMYKARGGRPGAHFPLPEVTEAEVPQNVMGMPADFWPNPINIPNYRSVRV